jgi:hypothetical protein
LNCHRRLPDGSPCLICESCVQFDTIRPPTHPNYLEFDGASEGSKERIKEILNVARHPPLWGAWRVICIDEAHGVSPQGLDAMLKLVEEPPPYLVWLFCTTDRTKMRAALISRCADCAVHLLDQAISTAYLQQVCRAENWAADPAALELIAHLAAGHPRDLLQFLEQVVDYGAVTRENTQTVFGLGFLTYLLAYLKALFEGDFPAQHAAFQSWPVPPARKVELLQEFLLYLLYAEVLHLPVTLNPVFATLQPADRQMLSTGWQRVATARGWRSEDLFHQHLWQFWGSLEPWNAATVELQLWRCHQHFHGARAPGSPVPAAPKKKGRRPQEPAFRSRTTATDRRQSLTVEEVGRLYDAVSFLNEDGLVLNTHVTIMYALLGVTGHAAGAKMLSDFHRRARASLRDQGYPYHFVDTHEHARDRGFHTHLLTCIDQGVQPAFYDCVESVFGTDRVGKNPVKDRIIPVLVQYKNLHNPDQQRGSQWGRLRYLCKELDLTATALDADGRRKPLHKLLGLKRSRQGNDVGSAQRSGSSREIGRKAQEEARTEGTAAGSAFQRGAWSELYSGWELLRTPRSKLRALYRIVDEPPIDGE